MGLLDSVKNRVRDKYNQVKDDYEYRRKNPAAYKRLKTVNRLNQKEESLSLRERELDLKTRELNASTKYRKAQLEKSRVDKATRSVNSLSLSGSSNRSANIGDVLGFSTRSGSSASTSTRTTKRKSGKKKGKKRKSRSTRTPSTSYDYSTFKI